MIIDLLTLVLLAAIFVGVPTFAVALIVHRLNQSDKRANSRNRELIENQRMMIENRNLELEIRKAKYDLAKMQLERGEELTIMDDDV